MGGYDIMIKQEIYFKDWEWNIFVLYDDVDVYEISLNDKSIKVNICSRNYLKIRKCISRYLSCELNIDYKTVFNRITKETKDVYNCIGGE